MQITWFLSLGDKVPSSSVPTYLLNNFSHVFPRTFTPLGVRKATTKRSHIQSNEETDLCGFSCP